MKHPLNQVHLYRKGTMFKRCVIFLTFLAYALTLAHNLVPHHHDDETTSSHRHHYESGKSHHHHDHKDKSLSQTFADAIHHPSSGLVIQPSPLVNVQKETNAIELGIISYSDILFPLLRPPDIPTENRTSQTSSGHYPPGLLRGPPVF
jgi:hypothetical protein